MITQRLQYNAPDSAPQAYMWFGTSPSGTMQARLDGCIKMEFIIPAAQQK